LLDTDDAGLLNLQTISSNTVSLAIGRFCSSQPTLAKPTVGLGAAIGAIDAALMTGIVDLLCTPSLDDSDLYTGKNCAPSSRAPSVFVYASSNKSTAASKVRPSAPPRIEIGKLSL